MLLRTRPFVHAYLFTHKPSSTHAYTHNNTQTHTYNRNNKGTHAHQHQHTQKQTHRQIKYGGYFFSSCKTPTLAHTKLTHKTHTLRRCTQTSHKRHTRTHTYLAGLLPLASFCTRVETEAHRKYQATVLRCRVKWQR